ncbi:hypothetical protein ACJX0J_037036, partial [Zea mays]
MEKCMLETLCCCCCCRHIFVFHFTIQGMNNGKLSDQGAFLLLFFTMQYEATQDMGPLCIEENKQIKHEPKRIYFEYFVNTNPVFMPLLRIYPIDNPTRSRTPTYMHQPSQHMGNQGFALNSCCIGQEK